MLIQTNCVKNNNLKTKQQSQQAIVPCTALLNTTRNVDLKQIWGQRIGPFSKCRDKSETERRQAVT